MGNITVSLYNIQKQIKFDKYDSEPVVKINNPIIGDI